MTLYEYWNVADPATIGVQGSFWQGQTFTPRTTHNITKVKLQLYRYGLPGTLTVAIRVTDADGHPAGDDLCSGEIDGNGVIETYGGPMTEIPFTTSHEVTKDVKYAIVARVPDGDQNNYIRWRHALTNPYGRGAHEFSPDCGVTWETDASKDLMFKEYGSP